MALLREEIVAEARTWLGTPYRHAQRAKGSAGGVDCLNLVAGVFQALGVLGSFDAEPYPSAWWRTGKDLISLNMERGIGALREDIECTQFHSFRRGVPDTEVIDLRETLQPGHVVSCGFMKKLWIPTHMAIVVDRRGDEITVLHADQQSEQRVIEERLSSHWRLFRNYMFFRVGDSE